MYPYGNSLNLLYSDKNNNRLAFIEHCGFTHINLHSPQLCKVGTAVAAILQGRKMRYREEM